MVSGYKVDGGGTHLVLRGGGSGSEMEGLGRNVDDASRVVVSSLRG